MTFEEAKKILDEELCFVIEKSTDVAPVDLTFKFNKYEKLRVREAIITMSQLGYRVYYDIHLPAYIYREKMLEREHNELLSSGTVEKMVGNRLKEKADEFSDSVLDELNDGHKSNDKRGKEIARLNKIINKKNKEIKEKSESARFYANKLVDAYHEIRELKERLKKIGHLCDTKEGNEIKQEEFDYDTLLKLQKIASEKFINGKYVVDLAAPCCDYSRTIIFKV